MTVSPLSLGLTFDLVPGVLQCALADMLSAVMRQAFSGRKDGYVFKKGEQGLGYYSDPLAWDLDAERDRLIRMIMGPLAGPRAKTEQEEEPDSEEEEDEIAAAAKEAAEKAAQALRDADEDKECVARCVNPDAGLHHKDCPNFVPMPPDGPAHQRPPPPWYVHPRNAASECVFG